MTKLNSKISDNLSIKVIKSSISAVLSKTEQNKFSVIFSRFKKFAIYGLLLCAIYFFIPNFININNSAVFLIRK